MTDRTHWDGCWRGHHGCAVALVNRLQVALADADADKRLAEAERDREQKRADDLTLDATRYRFIRSQIALSPAELEELWAWRGADLDAVIDHAMTVEEVK